ncbi:hypothetical protein C2845_PM01G27770 [Panicum miliaceum]|uniref:Uncharacterized protein n=1 Tax=Panicum miliaceum TaxID=4540 RepID=A0A3L6TIB1_PANMI|nr:hypothetical protein C2845_PM01G27770 [Panicum miliaceum]
MLNVSKLIEEGLINDKGWAERDETFQLAPGMPALQTSRMPWMDGTGTPVGQPAMFELIARYITYVWRTGLAVSPNAGGIVTKEELMSKVEQVLGDGDIRERARLLMDASRRCIGGSGSSCENFSKFVGLLSE